MTESAGTTAVAHERGGAQQPLLLTIERHEHHGVRRRVAAEPRSDRHDRGRAGRVVIGAVVDLAPLHTEMIVVGRHQDDAPGTLVSTHHRYHVGALTRAVRHGEALQHAGGEGVQPDRTKPFEHEGTGARATGRAQAPAFHGVGGECCEVGEKPR